MLFNIFAVAAYIRHLALLDQINIADSITQTQQKLSRIQASLNNVGRILILQAPLYCTFYYSDEMVAHAGTLFWLIQFVVVTFFVVVSVYLYRTLTMKNMHRKWVRRIMESFGGKTLMRAMEFVNEIEEYKMEKANYLFHFTRSDLESTSKFSIYIPAAKAKLTHRSGYKIFRLMYYQDCRNNFSRNTT